MKTIETHCACGEPVLDALVQAGYMTVSDAPRSSGWMYQATDKGREALGFSK